CWTICLLNIGPFVRCWKQICCSASSAILYPSIVCYYKSQRTPRLIGRGRRSSDVTVGYITYSETFQLGFQVGYRTSIWGAALTAGLISSTLKAVLLCLVR
ncbi:hypothetical protein AMECASPLE_030440, partial [Ameca splendens]